MELKRAALVLADISGYTGFVTAHSNDSLHAEQIIDDLLESVVTAAEYPLTLSKLEGDAAFMYAFGDDDRAVTIDVAKQITAFFAAFREKQRSLIGELTCPCKACTNVDKLRLKAILHFGEVVFKKIRQFEEIGGEPAIVVHRLAKNSVPAKEYILMSETFYTLCGGLADREGQVRTENAEGIGAIPVRVYYEGGVPIPVPAQKANRLVRFRRASLQLIYMGLRRVGLRKGHEVK